MNIKSIIGGAIIAIAAAGSAQAANLVTNGGFEQTTNGANKFLHLSAPTGWAEGNFVSAVYSAGAADTLGADQGDPNRFIFIWGPGDGTTNGLTAASPAGGNFLALDSDTDFHSTVSQVINGLTPGDRYTLSFYWAAAQYNDRQGNWNGATHSRYDVTFGNDSFSTPTLNIASHGFSGWYLESTTFTATSASQTLRFLAQGGPNGLPPLALLDGVSLTAAVPEPSSWAMLIAGFGIVGAAARRRRMTSVAA